MKNKKWKRKAKRLIGKCIRNSSCYGCYSCEVMDDCFLYCDMCKPVGLGVRAVEKRFKEGFKWQETLK